MKRLLLPILFCWGVNLLGQQMEVKKFNLTEPVAEKKIITEELERLTPDAYKNHPEYGVLPYNAPCTDCVELVDKRTESTRYFVKNGSDGAVFYSQQGYSPIHYKDNQGQWRSIDIRLKPGNIPHTYTASNQNLPVKIDAGLGFSSINRGGDEFKFNNQLELLYVDVNGTITSLGKSNWENYTAGAEGVKVVDAWPGIDIELKVTEGKVKSDFIVKQRPAQNSGKYIIRDNMELPAGHSFAGISVNQLYRGDFSIENASGEEAFHIYNAYAWDSNPNASVDELYYRLSQNGALDIEIPLTWLNADERQYPVTIDPLVTGTNTLPQLSITGSTYNPTCWTAGCNYNMAVAVPANCTVTDVIWSFNYQTLGGCVMNVGAIDLRYSICRSPSNAGFFWTCNTNTPGTCNGNNISVYSDFQSCIPAPQCASYNLNFVMSFYRCGGPGANCSNTCIGAASGWTMTVQGRTVQSTGVTGAQVICQGATVSLNAAGIYGVAPYSIVWNPGGINGSSISVSPASTTVYTATITDACGQIATANVTVNVNQAANPGFTFSPVSPCAGSPVSITGLGNGGTISYDWLLPGGAPATASDNKTPTVTYNTAGTYNITLNYNVSGCLNPLTQQITVNPILTPTATISVNPAMPVCAGTPLTFSAVITNGGTTPVYTWKLNGVAVGNGTTYTTSTYNNGDVVTLDLTSNAICVNPATITSNAITIQTTTPVTPSVTIVANPSGQICAGTSVTFTATATNGGPTPSYQWKLNGNNVGGNSITYNSAGLANGDVITVVMTTSLTCVTQPTATSNSITMTVVQPVTPSVSIASNPSGAICLGTNVTFTATPTNGGSTPGYQWLLNGANVGTNSATYSNNNLQNGDIVTVILTSNAACATPTTANSNQISMTVNPVITPSVTIAVNPTLPVCAGTNLTFTASPLNAGINPSYQWKVNGANVGTNSNTYSSSTLNNGDVVTVVLTSTSPCANPTTATSNSINVQISPVLIPSVGIAAQPNGAICAGTNVTFTATPTNGGTTPSYQWQLNGANVGANSATYTNSALVNGDVITVILTSSAGCANPSTATSNSITMTVNPVLTPSVTIADNPTGQQCQGTPITFTATPTNGGNTPGYQWQLNGVNVGTNAATYTLNNPANGDVVRVVLTSSATCPSPTTATSNSITLNILPTVVPSVTIAPDVAMPVCDGATVVFTATPTGGGTAPTYQWYVNGGAVAGETNATYSYNAVNGENITVEITSNAACASPTTATSAAFAIQSTAFVTPTVSITSNPANSICSGQFVTFTATPTDGGTTPTYQWLVNGAPAGTDSPTFTTNTINPGDVVEVVLTSNYPCLNQPTANSNQITLQINPPITVTINPTDVTICAYESAQFTASATGGDGGPYTFTWDNGDTGPTIQVSPNTTTSYTVTVTDQCGTTPGTATGNVTVNPTPIANFSFSPDSGITTLDDVFFVNESINGDWWTWTFSDGLIKDTSNTFSHNFPVGGVYTLNLSVTNNAGCVDDVTIKINVRDQTVYYVPSAFTPDQNGLNEVFYVKGYNLTKPYTMRIYDRWGQEVYNSETDSNGGLIYWTGQKHNTGDLLPDGVYVYYLYFDEPFLNKNRRTDRGTVTLIR